eukprot:8791-Pyramimonas_sp.AAC.1
MGRSHISGIDVYRVVTTGVKPLCPTSQRRGVLTSATSTARAIYYVLGGKQGTHSGCRRTGWSLRLRPPTMLAPG